MSSRVARTKPMRLLIESLEERCTPAGNVAAVLSGSTLAITGDAQDNQIQIQIIIDPDGLSVVIDGLSGTQVNGASSDWFPAFSVNSIVIQMNQGNDEVSLGGLFGLAVQGNLSVDLGAGKDELTFINTIVNGSTTIRARAGNDTINFRGGNTFTGPALVDLAQGNDNLRSFDEGPGPNSFNKSLRILGGAGDDTVSIAGNTTVGGTFEFQGQAGDDTLSALISTFKKLVVDTGVGNDFVQGHGITVQTSATVLLGVGDDLLDVMDSTFGSTFFDGGPGTDTFWDLFNIFGVPSVIVSFP